MYPTWNDKLCSELLDLFSINAFQRIKHLSKGTVVKLSLIIAVAHEPPLLILDEPTTGLDPLVRTEFLSAIKKRHRTSEQTILMSSHILSDIEALGAEVGILHAGHLLASGSITKLQGTVRVIGVLLPTGLESVALPRNTLWHSRQGEEFWLAVTAFDEPMLEDFTTKNRLKVIAVRGASLEELYLYYVREAGHHDNNAAVERPSS
jgi:ABC-2 type transport system ATP-binding protein